MSVTQLAEWVGAKVLVTFGDIKVLCIVQDVKLAYGRQRFLVQPVAGEGMVWVESTRVEGVQRG